MSKLINNIVKMDRGDSYDLDVTINNGDSFYTLRDNDKLYFALMEPNCEFEDAILYKILTSTSDPVLKENGKLVEYHINLEPNDTVHLTPGVYYYTIKLKMDHKVIDDKTDEETAHIKEVYTVIDRSKFIILGAIPSVAPTMRRVEYKQKIPCAVQSDNVSASFTINGEHTIQQNQGYIVYPGDILSAEVNYGVCVGRNENGSFIISAKEECVAQSEYIVPEYALYVIVEDW